MRGPSPALRRYFLLQLPGWALAATLMWWLGGQGLDPRLGAGLLLLWVAKDFALYPWLRRAYEPGDPDPGAALVGRSARVTERLDPAGYVRLGSELWRAELEDGAAPREPGDQVRVREVRGLTLRVEADEEGRPRGDSNQW